MLVLILFVILLPLPFSIDTINRLKKIDYNPMQVTVYEQGPSRLAIFEPFGWTLLNLNTAIYIFEAAPGRCKQNQSGVIILTPNLGYNSPVPSHQCYNATIASLCSIFKESIHETVKIDIPHLSSFTIIDAINYLLKTGLFKGT